MTYPVAILVFCFGAIIGSFLNVCIFRIGRGRSIVAPGSYCPNCEKPIRFYDNIPIAGYLILRGRCRNCSAPISFRYPLVEVITAGLFVWLYVRMGISLELPALMLLAALLIVISFIDLDLQIIPDVLSIGGLGAGLVLAFIRPHFGVLDAVYGIVLGGGILFLIAMGYQLLAKREGMGGGDVKLLAMIGSFLGLKGVVFSLMAGSLIGSLVGIPLMLLKGEGTKYAIPFGPFLSLAALIYVFFGDRLINGFLSFIS
jgi:leader peptidase (prepilin peptidase) / N-methyltransferase